ncbi:UDP-N-acetylmuramoyl-tripeptide--D-alanyl-D-alanine ligase [Thiobacter aerophilum]|uniref:UDP-N-acetylmuramoyl-tripeptide--D-alanyl-D-alanine ligase n=1 Tax=Thiobacter aerophilum TaxID=3121275 RepID=A0ABV0EFP8_9BURK
MHTPEKMLHLTEAAAAIGGEVHGADVAFSSVSTDTRTLRPGALFVALRGPRFDGHDFLEQARGAGAIAAMVDERLPSLPASLPLLRVGDTRLALGRLAAFWRRRFPIPLVAITGSNGKTTVKEMTAAILRAHCAAEGAVLATEGNLNNDIGVPLTLLRLTPAHRYAVIEMGMNHFGEIDYLSRLAGPQVALVNNAQAAHLAGVGSLEGVARAKGEIYGGLASDGIAVINADEAFAGFWRELAGTRPVIDFGLKRPAAVSGRFEMTPHGTELSLVLPTGTAHTRLNLLGVHNVRNALAAAAVAAALGIPAQTVAAGLAGVTPVKGRLNRKRAILGATFIDDSYNANPDSMRAAIDVLAAMPGKRVLVLGDMGELGEAAWQRHGEIGAYARDRGIDVLFCLGENARAMAEAFGRNAWHFERIEELLADLENLLAPDVTVLVKGSRFMQMERVVKSFALEE